MDLNRCCSKDTLASFFGKFVICGYRSAQIYSRTEWSLENRKDRNSTNCEIQKNYWNLINYWTLSEKNCSRCKKQSNRHTNIPWRRSDGDFLMERYCSEKLQGSCILVKRSKDCQMSRRRTDQSLRRMGEVKPHHLRSWRRGACQDG